MVSIIRTLIRPACIGNCPTYLQSLCDMQVYLASAGHSNYIKSRALFIPKMLDLTHIHPDVHTAFMKGLFPVKRTDGAWSGTFKDITSEVWGWIATPTGLVPISTRETPQDNSLQLW